MTTTCTYLQQLTQVSDVAHGPLVDAYGAFCYAKSLASFGCSYFVLHLSLGLVKVNPRLMMIFAKDRLLYFGNCFNNCFAILTRASFSSFVTKWDIHLALILLIFKSCLRII